MSNLNEIREISRIEKKKNDDEIFTLSSCEFDEQLQILLNGADINETISALEMFSRHYLYNPFEINEKTQNILFFAFSIVSPENENDNELILMIYKLLSHIADTSFKMLDFAFQIMIIKIFLKGIKNVNSSYFDKSLYSIKKLAFEIPDICNIVYNEIGSNYFFEIINHYTSNNNNFNPDIPLSCYEILFSFCKHYNIIGITEQNILDILNGCQICLSIELNNFKNQKNNPMILYILRSKLVSLAIIDKIFQISVSYQSPNYTYNIINSFNMILHLQIYSKSNQINKILYYKCLLISTVLKTYLPLLLSGEALKENGIDIVQVIRLLSFTRYNIQSNALDCINSFIRGKPDFIPMLFDNNLLLKLNLIFKRCSYNAKQKAISIVELVLKYGTDETKNKLFSDLLKNIIDILVSIAFEADDNLYLQCLYIFTALMEMEQRNGYTEIKDILLSNNISQLIDEKNVCNNENISDITHNFFEAYFKT